MMVKINLNNLEPAWAKVVGANKKEHDIFIPLYSQRAVNFRGTNTSFAVKTYSEYHHFLDMLHPIIHKKIVETIEKYFENK